MRSLVVAFALCVFGLGACSSVTTPIATPTPSQSPAQLMTATAYHDGEACPGNCDDHVVFHASHNGTANAFLPPLSNRAQPRACVSGQDCAICSSAADESCTIVRYRGNGPPKTRFDFTPRYLEQNCNRTDLPRELMTLCGDINKRVQTLAAHGNCFSSPSDPGCKTLMTTAKRLKNADRPEWTRCRTMGEAKYNASQKKPNTRRSENCSYEETGTGGPNSNGVTWRKILPGACGPGSYPGKNGTDCCANDLYLAASVWPECNAFFRARSIAKSK
jgi:hypothetical protein